MSAPVKTPGFVISVRDHGESDRIVHLFTRDSGRLALVAKGAKRSLKRFLNALEPFTLIEACHRPPRKASGLGLLESCSILDPFGSLRSSYEAFVAGSVACELAGLWTREHDPHPGLFELMGWLLQHLDQGGEPGRATMVFVTRILKEVGYGLDFDQCFRCGRELYGHEITFLPGDGLLCPSCQSEDSRTTPVATSSGTFGAGTIRSLAFLQDRPLEQTERLAISCGTAIECWRLLSMAHGYHLQKLPRSFNLISRMAEEFFCPGRK